MSRASPNKVHIVYWLRLAEHTDILSEGYIGTTCKTLEERFSEHLWVAESCKGKKNHYIVHKAINKYGADKIVTSVLLVGDKEYCYLLEGKLRPNELTGWNIAPGGRMPGGGTKGKQLSEEHKKKLSLAHTGKIISDETKAKIGAYNKGRKRPASFGAAISEAKKGMVVSEKFLAASKARGLAKRGVPFSEERKANLRGKTMWRSQSMNPVVWTNALELYNLWVGGNKSAKKLSSCFRGTSYSMFESVHKAFKSGWNPNEDKEYLEWREAYLKEKENHAT